MNKKITGVVFTAAGTLALIYCIMNDIGGIGRAALLLLGSVFITGGTIWLYRCRS